MPTVLVAADADWVHDEVRAALGGSDTTMVLVRAGRDVTPAVTLHKPDLAVLDLQIGNMGGMATCMSIRHEETADRLPITAVMMLLDRAADVFLAQRCEADGWLIKPLDSLRVRKAAKILIDGYSFFEGVDPETAIATDTAVIGA